MRHRLAALVVVGLLPLAFLAAAPTAPPTWRVVSYNIRHGRGTDERVDLTRTAAVLRALAPDVVGLQEVDRVVRRSGGIDEAAQLGASLGMAHAFGAFMPYQGGSTGSRTLALFHARAMEIAKPADDRFTFSSTAPVKEIDFVFAAPRPRWRALGARVITEPLASDHRPVVVELQGVGGWDQVTGAR